MLSRSTRDFARTMAVLCIAHWREAKAKGLPKSVARNRSDALFYIHAYKRGVTL